MSDTVYQSRALPWRHRKTLEEISCNNSRTFDGRSEKIIAALEAIGFIKSKNIDKKNLRKVNVSITKRGRNALERSRRGVDPYLVMTK
jgi:DNA-binding MarR family transcriptional regulator